MNENKVGAGLNIVQFMLLTYKVEKRKACECMVNNFTKQNNFMILLSMTWSKWTHFRMNFLVKGGNKYYKCQKLVDNYPKEFIEEIRKWHVTYDEIVNIHQFFDKDMCPT